MSDIIIWHKDLIEVLPDGLLRNLWNNCCLFSLMWQGHVERKGICDQTFKILKNFSAEDFKKYCSLVKDELEKRTFIVISAGNGTLINDLKGCSEEEKKELYTPWHNRYYLKECMNFLDDLYWEGVISKIDNATCWDFIINEVGDFPWVS